MNAQPTYYAAPTSGASNAKTIIAVVLIALISSVAAFFAFRASSSQSQSQPSVAALQETVASLQSQLASSQVAETPQATSAPLCPENYSPVVDINGKVYKNACYAQSVGAQFAPTPYTGTGSVSDPVAAELLKNIPKADGSKTTMSPGSAAIPNIHDVMNQAFGKPQTQTTQQTPAKTSTPSLGSLGPGNTVVIPKPAYAGF